MCQTAFKNASHPQVFLADVVTEDGHEGLHIGVKAVPPHGLQLFQRVFIPVAAAVPVDDHHRHVTVVGQHTQQGVIGVLVERGLELVLKVGQNFHVQIDAQWALPRQRRLQISDDFLLVGHRRHFRCKGPACPKPTEWGHPVGGRDGV
ncbi:hypothetical protein HHS34_010125 [Acidithiobacillus montserratensis]|uniref:Uncharacterized protein n=1 Tax=Acidithiobacillus montserratensis TaxID=2729135 RepID=A0ACD5HCY1_9PROT|nr:hypothetical protein [Acidithiobacillus montserratensis]MBU2747418.1 hypothetical protein [Acidithiobacillus montserratensis]